MTDERLLSRALPNGPPEPGPAPPPPPLPLPAFLGDRGELSGDSPAEGVPAPAPPARSPKGCRERLPRFLGDGAGEELVDRGDGVESNTKRN